MGKLIPLGQLPVLAPGSLDETVQDVCLCDGVVAAIDVVLDNRDPLIGGLACCMYQVAVLRL
jgi:hypothetical protein